MSSSPTPIGAAPRPPALPQRPGSAPASATTTTAPVPATPGAAAAAALPATVAGAAPPAVPPTAPAGGKLPPPPRPTVGPATAQLRHWALAITFALAVVLPSLGAAFYLFFIADDQYSSKVGFAVRREDSNSAMGLLSGLTQLSGSSSSDTDVLYEYIQSQRLVADIDEALDLYQIWSRPAFDPVYALDPDAPLEDLVAYWNKMVRLSFGKGSGLLEVEVRAFDPDDAQRITQTLFEKSADKINELSAVAREDAIAYTRDEMQAAQERLRDARTAMTRFRNENQMIDPSMDLQGKAGVLTGLQAQQTAAMIDIDLLRETSREGDPRLTQAERKLAVIKSRIEAEREKLGLATGQNGDRAMADIVGDFESLTVDREFAERAYLAAMAAYDKAIAESQRKTRYLAAYMQPTRANSSQYPHRFTIWALITLVAFVGWSIAALVVYSLRDRR